ncbi:kinase-like domain-containing protein [Lentinula raphanica]|uniref:Kinase-like domain-containing protein n=1 Tax=Lentinula raphanica TaxID=153919 RepID=A0AA38PI92_9AGAR|nr:kinase-like domain-containing protein [Lentinula raphanica]
MTMADIDTGALPDIEANQNNNQIETKVPNIQVRKKNRFDFIILEFRAWLYRRHRLRRLLRWPYIYNVGIRTARRIGPNTFIKSGYKIRHVEAQTMAFVRAHTSIPVPRPYEILLDSDGRHYLVMEYIDSSELTWVWSSLSEDQQQDIIDQIGKWWSELRQIPSPGTAICALDGGLHSITMHAISGLVPLLSFSPHTMVIQYFEELLAKEHHIVFTHCDLAPRNILVKDGRIVAIIDWECAGWFPEYWEAIQIEYANGIEIPSFGKKLVKSVFPNVQNEQLLEYELSKYVFRG